MTVKQAISILDVFIDSVNGSNDIDGDTIEYVYRALDYLKEHCEITDRMVDLHYGDADE